MRFARFSALFLVVACSSAVWTDTFEGSDTRSTTLSSVEAGPPPDIDAFLENDNGGSGDSCDSVAASTPTVPITVTFPNHGTNAETIHIVAAKGSCDLTVDSDTDSVIFVSDAMACASLIAAGTPESGTAQVSGTDSPNDMLFLWSYGDTCSIQDDYSLSKK